MDNINTTEDEIGLKEFVGILKRDQWLILGVVLVCTLIAVTAALLSTKQYEATVVISPVTDETGANRLGGLGSIVSQVGQLASLTGLSIGDNTQKSESLAVLQSDALTERFILANDLLPILYPKDWDVGRHAWMGTDTRKIPTLWQAKEYFKKRIRTVNVDTKTGLATLVVDWRDPTQAANWANGLVKMTNDYLRNKTINEAQRNIAYLNEEAGKTDVVGVKTAIYSILQNEIYKMMLARGSDEYALKVIDPALAPEKPSSPRKVVWTLLGLFAGMALSLIVVLGRLAWERG